MIRYLQLMLSLFFLHLLVRFYMTDPDDFAVVSVEIGLGTICIFR